MLLPKLADGFQRQKGDIFGFGLSDEESDIALSGMDSEKLESAPIHNLDSERAVGFISYELKHRGAKNLKCASTVQVKAKSQDLIESQSSGSFREYGNIAKFTIPAIMKAWDEQQKRLQQQGLSDKEIANLALDKRRNNDLNELKKHGGPFTKDSDVDELLKSNMTEDEKQKRLYLEIRYARDTALSVPKQSDMFRLLKDRKKLASSVYGANLKAYLSNLSCKADVTMTDLNSVLDGMNVTAS